MLMTAFVIRMPSKRKKTIYAVQSAAELAKNLEMLRIKIS